MPKFAANLSMLYNELDFLDRFAAAAQFGFGGVEYHFPYAYPKEQLADRLHEHGLQQVLHNLPPGPADNVPEAENTERRDGCFPGHGPQRVTTTT